MITSQSICDLLNSLLEQQPEIAELLDTRIKANETVANGDRLNIRTIDGEEYITVTGIISAISRLSDDLVVSVYDTETHKLIGFQVATSEIVDLAMP